MAGGGQPRKTINWGAINTAFTILVVIIAGLMGYAYINGGTASRLGRIEADLREKATQQDIASLRQYIDQNKARRDDQINELAARMERRR